MPAWPSPVIDMPLMAHSARPMPVMPPMPIIPPPPIMPPCSTSWRRSAEARSGSGTGLRGRRTGASRACARAGDLPVALQPPVHDRPDKLAVHLHGRALLDDQRTGHSPAELLQAVGMRVVPERAGIGRREFVDEFVARADRRLGDARDAVHADGQADAMPMNRCVLVQLVVDDDRDRFSPAPAQRWPPDDTIGGPHRLRTPTP